MDALMVGTIKFVPIHKHWYINLKAMTGLMFIKCKHKRRGSEAWFKPRKSVAAKVKINE